MESSLTETRSLRADSAIVIDRAAQGLIPIFVSQDVNDLAAAHNTLGDYIGR